MQREDNAKNRFWATNPGDGGSAWLPLRILHGLYWLINSCCIKINFSKFFQKLWIYSQMPFLPPTFSTWDCLKGDPNLMPIIQLLFCYGDIWNFIRLVGFLHGSFGNLHFELYRYAMQKKSLGRHMTVWFYLLHYVCCFKCHRHIVFTVAEVVCGTKKLAVTVTILCLCLVALFVGFYFLIVNVVPGKW